MALTPLDILQKKFESSRRVGYDPEEVHRFLDAVREAWETTLRDNARLQDELRARDADVDRLRAEQGEIQETLILARRLSVDLEGSARREADLIVGEARLDAERILAAAHEEERQLQAVVVRLKAARLHHIAQMRALIDAHQKLLDEYDRNP